MESKDVQAYGVSELGEPISPITIQRRKLHLHDVEFEVLYCGICHSDLHQIKNDWGWTTFPIVPGHEIVGRVTAIGKDVTDFKVGDLAAVGCLADSCQSCDNCGDGEEQFCDTPVFSYGSKDKYLGGMTYGGYSKAYVCEDKYVLHVPESLDLAGAAPLLCAGITVYSPLKHWNAGPGKSVGVVGIGGLGHMAVKIAKAMGAEVTAFTTSESKVEDALRLGADHVVLSKDQEQMDKQKKTLDVIIDTVSAKHDVNVLLGILKVDGALVLVGAPSEPLDVRAFSVVMGRKSFSGSNIGGIRETQEMLNFCAEHNITADIEIVKVQELNEAMERLEKNDVKYRFVIDLSTDNE